jgi:hypothetical protein
MEDAIPQGALIELSSPPVVLLAVSLLRRMAKGYHAPTHEADATTALEEAFCRGCSVCEARKFLAHARLGWSEYMAVAVLEGRRRTEMPGSPRSPVQHTLDEAEHEVPARSS